MAALSETPPTHHINFMFLSVLNIKIWSHQILVHSFNPVLNGKMEAWVWGRGVYCPMRGTNEGALYIMRNSFVLCNIVSYQTSSIWTLQWQVYTLLSFMTFKTFIFWIIFIPLMLSFSYFALSYTTSSQKTLPNDLCKKRDCNK